MYIAKIDQMRLLNSTNLEGYYNLKKLTMDEYNASSTIVNLDGEIFIDLDETVFLQVNLYHFKENSSQLLIHLPNMTICSYNRIYYKHFLMKSLKNVSNFPQFEADESTCVKKVSNSVQDFY